MIAQIGAVIALNLRALPHRFWNSLVIVVGIAGVVGVLVSVLAMSNGLLDSINRAGRPDRAIVLRGGSHAELSSTLARDATLTIADAPGVARTSAGKPIASAEEVMILGRPAKGGSADANVTLRGVGPQGLALRPEIHLVEGRWFTPGLRELVVGRAVQAQFDGLTLGGHITLRNAEWTIVGVFESNGDSHESEVLTDADTVMAAYGRNLFQSITVKLETPQSFDAFKDSLTTNPQLSVEVHREPEYLASLSENLNNLMRIVAHLVGGIMAVGAVFGALNTMYSAVSARSLEIATLRAVGFGATPIVVSVLVESLLLAFLGGVLGAALAWMFFDGHAVNSLGGNFTQLVFHLDVTPDLIGQGIVWASFIGLLGGLFPAIRAARLPIATALRAI
jgi:putative ABC transport system permease protein